MKPSCSVSVVIPVYNGERYLAEAIDSVLEQTLRPLEVIVVDDGSTDSSMKVAQRFGEAVRCCFEPHRGAGAARNHGAETARGEFLAFLDADDAWVREKLARQLKAFENAPGLDAVFGEVQQFLSPDLDEDMAERLLCPAESRPGYLPGSMLIRQGAFQRMGRFETSWRIGESIDWYLKATEKGLRSLMLPEVLLRRRLHASNLGLSQRHNHLDYVRILKASLDRRRATRNTSHPAPDAAHLTSHAPQPTRDASRPAPKVPRHVPDTPHFPHASHFPPNRKRGL